MVGNVLFQSATHNLEKSFETIDFLLEFAAIANTKARLLTFFVDTYSIVPRTPATGRFDAVAFNFSRLAQFAAMKMLELLTKGNKSF